MVDEQSMYSYNNIAKKDLGNAGIAVIGELSTTLISDSLQATKIGHSSSEITQNDLCADF